MAMLLLCFVGMMVMFIFVIRSLASQSDESREAFRKQHLFLADLERQIMDLRIAVNARLSLEEEEGEGSEDDAPLSLLTKDDPLLAMLDAASQSQASYLAAGLKARRREEHDQAPRGQSAPAPFPATPDLFHDDPFNISRNSSQNKDDALALHEDYRPSWSDKDAPSGDAVLSALDQTTHEEQDDDKPAFAEKTEEKGEALQDAAPEAKETEERGPEKDPPAPTVMRLEEQDEALWAEQAGLWDREESDEEPAPAPGQAETTKEAPPLDDWEGPEYGFKVYHLGNGKGAKTAQSGDGDSAVRGLLEDVGKAMNAGELFAGPDKRTTEDRLSFGRLPELAPKPVDPHAGEEAPEEARGFAGLMASYNALRSRTKKLAEEVSDALFTPPDDAPAPKRLRVGPPAGEDFERVEAQKWLHSDQNPAEQAAGRETQASAASAAPVAEPDAVSQPQPDAVSQPWKDEPQEPDQLPDLGPTETTVRPDAVGHGSIRPGWRPAAVGDTLALLNDERLDEAEALWDETENRERPERRAENGDEERSGDQSAGPAQDAPQDQSGDQEEEQTEEQDAITAYASRFLSDQEASSLAVIARRPHEKRHKHKRKAIGKRGSHSHSTSDE
jgi:hypothetical protein